MLRRGNPVHLRRRINISQLQRVISNISFYMRACLSHLNEWVSSVSVLFCLSCNLTSDVQPKGLVHYELGKLTCSQNIPQTRATVTQWVLSHLGNFAILIYECIFMYVSLRMYVCMHVHEKGITDLVTHKFHRLPSEEISSSLY